jgi:hypothetical protein
MPGDMRMACSLAWTRRGTGPLVTDHFHAQLCGHPGAEVRRKYGIDLRAVVLLCVNADWPCVRVPGSVVVYC